MKYFHDTVLQGHALVFDGPLDLIKAARKACESPDCPPIFKLPPECNFPGRKGKGWQAFEQFFHTPWLEALKRVEYVQEKILKEHSMPTPKSMRRKPKFNDVDGDIDTDRALRGEPEFYRKVQREKRTGPMHVALVCNLDRPYHVNPSGLFFRSTAAIAVTDILEDLGYSVEIWMWCRGERVYPKPDHNQFTACKIKEAGDPIDKSSLCDTLSAWFCSDGVFGTFPIPETKPKSYGLAIEANQSDKVESSNVGGWIKYMDITQGVIAIPVPMVTGSLDNAVDCAKKTLTNLISQQEGN